VLDGYDEGVSGPTIMNSIDPGRNRAELVDDLFGRFANRLAANPQRHEHFIAVVLPHRLDRQCDRRAPRRTASDCIDSASVSRR
jgi:hypothetical protein